MAGQDGGGDVSWSRVPAFLARRVPTDRPACDAEAWLDLLCRWEQGEDPGPRELMRAWTWGANKVYAHLDEVRLWAIANGAAYRPPREHVGAPGALFDGEFEHPGPLTHADVVDRALRWLRGHHGCKVAFAEINTYELVNPDAIGFRRPAGSSKAWSVLVEAKISRSDFRADREKMIHRLPDSCPGQERWYLTPPGMLRAEEIPPGWGLAEVGKRSVRIVVEAPKGEHVHGRAHADMGILLSAVRRHQVGAKWLHDLGKFEPWDGKS